MHRNIARFRTTFLCAATLAAAACGNSSSTRPSPPPCTYVVTASPASFEAAGGAGAVTVASAAGCAWTARADAGWLSIATGSTGTGNGTVTFGVAANGETTRRTGTLTVAGQQVSIQQDASAVACTYSLSPANASMGKNGGTGTFAVTTGATCAWTAESSAAWLTVTGASQGTGNATISYSASRNSDVSGRTASIRLGGETFTFTQSGDVSACQYSIVPIEFSPCMAAIELSSQIATDAACPWRAAAGASWITLTSSQSGSGNGTVRFRVSENYDAPRSGVVELRWDAPTAGQNLRIAQAGCHYAVVPDTFSIAAAGGTGTFDVLQESDPNTCGSATQDRCVWTAQSNVAWIVVTSSMPRSGDNPVAFTIAANDGAARTGTITVRNKVVQITQSGR